MEIVNSESHGVLGTYLNYNRREDGEWINNNLLNYCTLERFKVLILV